MATLKHHASLTVEKWAGYTFGRQLLMIANETNRSAHWATRADTAEARRCIERAVELLQLTLATSQGISRLRELCRLKEVLLSLYSRPDIPASDLQAAQRALVARSPESWALLSPMRGRTGS